MNNIAVLRNEDGTFSHCPVFDNGVALFSDTSISYSLDVPLEECYRTIEAKPFNRSFDEQMDAAEELYGTHFHFWFTEKDVLSLLNNASDFYDENITSRVLEIFREQMRKYQYFRR